MRTCLQVGVPLKVALVLTYPERVTDFNIERLRAAVSNGPSKYPGARSVRLASGIVKSLDYGDCKQAAMKELLIGDGVT